ncbi:ArsR family transcriptional regulator [Haloarchaeobius sp. FL176]|uniref:winged helix-turn-helix transcriptional regulator n=1 Tax=Haloarchaeobius sp. FL176 TaxID=2967129 RepID=UPI002147D698|nr:ArsR family transcriptional regulator [Haloarchaeobius sp. FL176]
MTETRVLIANEIEGTPGIHFNELVRELPVAPGQVQYHVRDLVDTGRVVREELFGRTHYYPPGYDAFDRAAVALIRRETTREVLVTLIEDGPLGPATVADEVGIARSTLEHHVDNLGEVGLVEKRRDAHNRVTLVLAAPERTGELLSDVTPTMPARLVDRFTLLVDELLAE